MEYGDTGFMETESLIMGAEREASKEMLKKCQDIIISAWVALPEGNYTPAQIENWLVNEMAPAINYLRDLKPEDLVGE